MRYILAQESCSRHPLQSSSMHRHHHHHHQLQQQQLNHSFPLQLHCRPSQYLKRDRRRAMADAESSAAGFKHRRPPRPLRLSIDDGCLFIRRGGGEEATERQLDRPGPARPGPARRRTGRGLCRRTEERKHVEAGRRTTTRDDDRNLVQTTTAAAAAANNFAASILFKLHLLFASREARPSVFSIAAAVVAGDATTTYRFSYLSALKGSGDLC